LLVERCTPAEVQGVDPSEGQLAFARTRPAARVAQFRRADAMALPFAAGTFDAAVMALVIFFVPDPAKGVSEMARVVGPGGTVATYVWDIFGGGFPQEVIHAEIAKMGLTPVRPPRSDASRMDALRDLWTGGGLHAIETREITVRRTFVDFDDFWTINLLGSTVRPTVATMSPTDVETLKSRVRVRLPADAAGHITCLARANAITGRLPK
jgi:SAM-dependent methyltransferase